MNIIFAIAIWAFTADLNVTKDRDTRFWEAIDRIHELRDFERQKQEQRESEAKLAAVFAISSYGFEDSEDQLLSYTGLGIAVSDLRTLKTNEIDLPSLLAIKMPCGAVFRIEWGDTAPTNDVPCTCGNPKHWFIRFERR